MAVNKKTDLSLLRFQGDTSSMLMDNMPTVSIVGGIPPTSPNSGRSSDSPPATSTKTKSKKFLGWPKSKKSVDNGLGETKVMTIGSPEAVQHHHKVKVRNKILYLIFLSSLNIYNKFMFLQITFKNDHK